MAEKPVLRSETNLGAMLRCFMAMERWSMRKLAAQIGVSAATLHRICAGYAMDADTLLKVLNWMVRHPSMGCSACNDTKTVTDTEGVKWPCYRCSPQTVS